MVDIGGPKHISPQDKAMYQQEYKHGVDIFKNALNEYTSAHEVHKKEAFRNVMNMALEVLNDTARGLMRKDLLAHNKAIQKDLQSYQNSQEDADKAKLISDLDRAQKKIE